MKNVSQGFPVNSINALGLIAIWLSIIAFAFDFRTQTSGGSVFHLLMAATLAVGCVASVLNVANLEISRIRWKWYFVWLAILILGIVSAYVNHVPIRTALLISSSYIGFFVGMLAALPFFVREPTILTCILPVIVAAVISSGSRLVTGMALQGGDIATMRFQILSPLLLVLFSISYAAILTLRKGGVSGVIGVAFCITLSIVSVTRSFIFVYFIVIACGFWMIRGNVKLPGFDLHRRIFWVIGGLAVSLAIGLAVAIKFRPDVVDSWIWRFKYVENSKASKDVNYLARLSESRYIVNNALAEPSKTFLGSGFGADYYYDDYIYPEISDYIPRGQEIPRNYPSHVMLVYFIHFGGASAFVLGLIFFAKLLYCAHANCRFRLEGTGSFFQDNSRFINLAVFLGLVANLSLSLTFNLFFERLNAVVIGFYAGLVFATYYKNRNFLSRAKCVARIG